MFGDYSWLLETKGQLSDSDTAAELLRAAKMRIERENRPRAILSLLDPLDIALPDTPTVMAAADFLALTSPPYLVNHCYRSYYLGRMFVRDSMDIEAAAIGFLLHDVGLTDWGRQAEGECFTLDSCRATELLLVKFEWSDRRIRLVLDTIALHLNVVPADGPEAAALRLGSGADVAGLGLEMIPAEFRTWVEESYPLLDQPASINEALKLSAIRCPCGRHALVRDRLGFEERILAR